MYRYILVFSLILVGAIIGACKKDMAKRTPQIGCRLALQTRDNAVEAHLVFTNISTTFLEIPESKLLANGKMTWDALEITLDGKRATYMCITVLPDPNKEPIVTLAPGGTFESTINLSACYEIEKPGTYCVRYFGRIWCESTQESIDVISNTVFLTGCETGT